MFLTTPHSPTALLVAAAAAVATFSMTVLAVPSWSGTYADGRCSSSSSEITGPAGKSGGGTGGNLTVTFSAPCPTNTTGATSLALIGSLLAYADGQPDGKGSWLPFVTAYPVAPIPAEGKRSGNSAPSSSLTSSSSSSSPSPFWSTVFPATFTSGYPEKLLACSAPSLTSIPTIFVAVTVSLYSSPSWAGLAGLSPMDGFIMWSTNLSATSLVDATCSDGALIISSMAGDIIVVDVSTGEVKSSSHVGGYGSLSLVPAAASSSTSSPLPLLSSSPTLGPSVAVLAADMWGVAAVNPMTGKVLWNRSSSLQWEYVGMNSPISPDGSLIVGVNFTNLVCLRTKDGSVAWTWVWPNNWSLGGTDALLAWADSPTGSPSGAVVFASNLEMVTSPYTEFPYLSVLDGATGKLLAASQSQQLPENTVIGGGNLVVDKGCAHIYTTTWQNPEGARKGGNRKARGEGGKRAKREGKGRAERDAPIPTTLVTVFAVDADKGTIEVIGYGPPVVNGNLQQTYALGPADGQIALQTSEGTVQVLELAAA